MNNNGTASVIGEYEYPLDQDWEVDRLQLKFMEKLGEGAFGLVYKVDTKYDDGRIVPAAVKMLKSGHTDQDVCDLVKEAQIMKTIGR
jgi:predicted Ser/Thr protein kinase